MSVFVRKNALLCTVTVKAADGSATQPTEVAAHLSYNDLAGLPHTATVPLSYNSTTGQWQGTWDTTAAGTCTVRWVVYTDGAIEAAEQGEFRVIANRANTV